MEYTAAALAMRYGEDVERAQIAGLLHDCAKCMENDKLLSACEKYHLPATDVEKRNPYLLHARVGSYLAKKEYKIEDPEILSAILYHTTGRPGMTLLEQIILLQIILNRVESRHRTLPRSATWHLRIWMLP